MNRILFLSFVLLFALSACQRVDDDDIPTGTPELHFRFQFDAQQERLNNLGQVATLPSGHAAQTPIFQKLSVHVLDLTPNQFTPYGEGFLVFKGPETNAGGAQAINFDEALVGAENEVFYSTELANIPPGTYEYARVSVSYQLYDIKFNLREIPIVGELLQQSGRVASFVGYNTYLTEIQPKDKTLTVMDDKLQGFWALELDLDPPYQPYNQLFSGEAPAGATTVVNPLASTSGIPAGSCVVTGKFSEPLVITGDETKDLFIDLSFSINQSFEWIDMDSNGQLDFYLENTAQSDQIVDMGLRGLIPSWKTE
ncbi:MAG: hypothetical protein KDC34_12245 [Saprospiraceae bacterium]|nr:hypothetical protein [Saprospiraceae bacterium]